MELNQKHYPVIIFSLFSFFIVLLILTLVIQNIKKTNNKKTPTPTPNYSIPTTHPRTKTRLTPLPTLIIPTLESKITPDLTPIESTGVKDYFIPQKLVDYTEQKTSLRQKLPLEKADFSIDFDYNEGKFIVKLKEPQEENQKKFEDWLKENYPLIPKDQFILQ